MELSGDVEAVMLRDERDVVRRLGNEVGLGEGEAVLYLKLLREGSVAASSEKAKTKVLVDRGMAIVSGDGKRIIPVHPRLGVANHYRTWRERMVKEINEKRMRVDSLILELIPLYEAATEKRPTEAGR